LFVALLLSWVACIAKDLYDNRKKMTESEGLIFKGDQASK